MSRNKDEQWDYIEAYDVNGNIHLLDVYQLPNQPVLIVSLDQQQATREGIAVMRQVFSSNQILEKSKLSSNQTSILSDTQADKPISCTAIEQISLKDDREPWISGKADIYGIVTGINPTRVEPMLDVIDMHYLDHDKKEYYPNQIIIHWEL